MILKYKREIIIAVLTVTVILLWFGKGCGDKGDELKAIAAENKVLKEKVRTDSITRANQRIAETAQIAAARQETAAAISDKQASDKQLTALQRKVDKYINLVWEGRPFDTGNVIISKVDSPCLELAIAAKELSSEVDRYRKESDEAQELMNYEIVLRDSVIEKEVAYSDSLRNDFNRQSALLKTALAVGRPRGRFLIGVGVLGNQEKILGGGSVKFGYLTKRGKLYLYSPHLLQLPGMPKAGLYHEVGVLFNPFK